MRQWLYCAFVNWLLALGLGTLSLSLNFNVFLDSLEVAFHPGLSIRYSVLAICTRSGVVCLRAFLVGSGVLRIAFCFLTVEQYIDQ